MRWIALFTLCSMASFSSASWPVPPLPDSQGRVHRLAEDFSVKATAIVFLMPDCPMCQGYAPTFNRLAAELPAGIELVGVVSTQHYSPAEVKKFADDYQLKMPVLVDRLQTLARWLKPTHAPEAFLIRRDGTVLYRGQINNGYVAPGKKRAVVSEEYLLDAMRSAAKGQPVKTSRTPAIGCLYEDEFTLPKEPTYHRDVAPILVSRCVSCHRPGEVAPFALLSYTDAAKRAKQLAKVCEARTMPPWKPEANGAHFIGERRLLDVEIQTLSNWADQGAKEGDLKDGLPAPRFDSHWHLGQPDFVIKMPKSFSIPASGKDILRNFVIPIPEANDQFVVAMEFRPGNPKVVHHALCLLDATGKAKQLDAAEPGEGYDAEKGGIGFLPTGSLGGWAPGVVPRRLPDGMGRFLAKGSDLVLQIHYHPTGKEEQDRSEVAVYLAKKPVQRALAGFTVENWEIAIPPGEAHYQRKASYTLPVDLTFVGTAPHMHLLGREMKVWAELPNGQKKPLVEVKDWDFNWQDYYVYREPFTLPKGTTIRMESRHDNSETNPANPWKPTRRIGYGEGTDDEMSLCIFEVTANAKADLYYLMLDNLRHNKIIERFRFTEKKK